MNTVVIEETVDSWSDMDRHAFWDMVAFKVADEGADPEDAIAESYDVMTYAEEYR
jgi:hypothetical protein